MIKPRAALWRFLIAAIFSAVLVVVITNAVRQPVQTAVGTSHFTAEFTDVSGLSDGADVRVRGVRVGKVNSIELKHTDDGSSVARVGFTMDNRYTLVPDSRLAVKFQALTGLRYIDVQHPAETRNSAGSIKNVSTAMTHPSFDITVLFNGLQPVLATLSPDEINTFTENANLFLQGDERGLGPMLDSIRTLTGYVANRQQVVQTLVQNLATLSDGVRTRSESLFKIFDEIELPLDEAVSMTDEFRKAQVAGTDFTHTVLRLLAAAGIRPGININRAFDTAITNSYDFLDIFKKTPVFWENIPEPPDEGTPVPCSKGRAQLPETVDVLLNGQRVVLCKK